MIAELHFNLARTETYKVAKFQNIEQKNKYVEAEMHNLKCKDAYFNFCAAKSPEERTRLASIVDATRYTFFTKFTRKRQENPLEVA